MSCKGGEKFIPRELQGKVFLFIFSFLQQIGMRGSTERFKCLNLLIHVLELEIMLERFQIYYNGICWIFVVTNSVVEIYFILNC